VTSWEELAGLVLNLSHVTRHSPIMWRKRGEAGLTIFVKPDGAGSQVQIFTEGLAWEEKQ
jgi:hypothetical protein